MIRGAKGGGGQRTPIEAPDSLRSSATARVVDLVSEGEIEGLVDGLRSVYLDETPIQNPNGSMNFQGVGVEWRYGTQSQEHMPGFPQVENSLSVGVEIKQTAAVVRQFTNPNLDAVSLTIGVPALLYQNQSNGDTTGTGVMLQVDVQSNGGGFVAAPVGLAPSPMSWAGGVLSSGARAGTSFDLSVRVTSSNPKSNWVCEYRLSYRQAGTTAWTVYGTRTARRAYGARSTLRGFSWAIEAAAAQGATADQVWLSLPSGAYEFKAEVVSMTAGHTATIELAGNVYVPGYNLEISGKTTSRYQRTVRIDLHGAPPWDIRIRRVTPDSTTQTLQNKTFLDITTEVIDAKLRYPNSAYFGLTADASQFSSVPRRSYHLRGLRVKVPTNYNPVTREYTGAWDGLFKISWTDNPAWCFYDILTNNRYGLGDFLPPSSVDKWALYSIGRYCDEFVPDGDGGYEPRFTCNLYLQSREEAFKVLADMSSIFRGMAYWATGSITAVQDAPADPAYLYTPANVIDGMFNYTGSALRTRHTVALVAWNDPDDFYRQKVEYVEDAAGIARYGVVSTELVAFGCASRGQAHRLGKWLLFTERLQSEVVTFKAGLDGNLCRPGQIIKVADPARAGARMGGRLVSADLALATLDAPVTIAAGETYLLSTLKADGTPQERTVTNAAGTHSTLSLSAAWDQVPTAGSVWVLSASNVEAQTFRVLSVVESGPSEFEVTALAHEPGKYALIENGLQLQPREISLVSSRLPAPTGGTMSEYLYEAATDLKTVATFAWDAVEGAQAYSVSYRRDNGNPVQLTDSATPSVVVMDAVPGAYEVTVKGINALGMLGAPLTYTAEVLGKVAPPQDVAGLQLQVQTGGAIISWSTHPDLDVRLGGKILIRHSTALTGATWNTSVPLAEFAGSSTSGVVPLLAGTYLAKAEDTSGVQSINPLTVVTTAADVLQYNAVATRYEQPAFAGDASGLVEAGGWLILSESGTWDDIVDFDAAPGIDGATVESGTYYFAAPVDIGGVYTCRVTADIQVQSYDVFNIVDTWASVDAVSNIDGTLGSDSADVRLYVSTTNDDPSGAPDWSAYRPFTVGNYTARAYRFRLDVARGPSPAQQVAIKRLGVTVDVPDRVEGADNVAVGTAGIDVTFAAEFFATPAVAVTADGMATGDYFTITNKTTSGFRIRFFNSAGTAIARTMDWIAKGYGYKT